MSTINDLLYRPIKQGSTYEGLIPAYKGTDFKFDKDSDKSTTYDTLRYMAQWSNKYASQMKRIAPLLKGKSIEETANNIYQFLYNHFQYKLDGEMQNLYSPSAAWHFRKAGFDCKTYSILASTILQNLNITHAFRMVQQAGIMPGEWSHVYVVIPNGNQHAIIDATTHTNKEVFFTKKHDYTMKHRGLASPYIQGLGCACQGRPINQSGLGAPSTMAATIANFHVFLNEAEKRGMPRSVANRMLELVKWNVQKGIDPNMQEIAVKAYTQTNNGLGLTEPITLNNLAYQAGSAIGNISVSGVNIGTTANQLISGDYLAAGLNILKNIIPLEKTFGAVFANGFDLSCWNATFSEQEAKKDMELDFPFILEYSKIFKSTTVENLNKFMLLTENQYQDAIDPRRATWSNCSKKGHALVAKGVLKLRQDLFAQFQQQGFQLVNTGKKTETMQRLPFPGKGRESKDKLWAFVGGAVTYDTFQIIPPAQVQQQQQIQNGSVAQNTGYTGENPTGNNNAITTPAKKSSATTPLLIGAAALALKFLI